MIRALIAVVAFASFAAPAICDDKTPNANRRVVILMIDGFGPDYYEQSSIPNLKRMAAQGSFTIVSGVMPAVTNVNNASIVCGAWPETHGITGNSYFDAAKGAAEYMEDAASVLVPTLFERGAKRGVKSALLSSKKKTIALLSKGTELAITAEDPPAAVRAKLGDPPPIYSAEINHWLYRAMIDVLKSRPDIGLLYVHTTDYPMHTWPPAAPESQAHLEKLDALLGEAAVAAPDAAFVVTADHGMNFKTRCWDLARACANRGLELEFALSAERDKYVKHHRTFGGTAWVWLKSPRDAEKAKTIIAGLEGVESVLSRSEAAERFHLMPSRIGELAVLGDRETVFGEMETERETLAPGFRSHGSLHEAKVPLILFNTQGSAVANGPAKVNFDAVKDMYRN